MTGRRPEGALRRASNVLHLGLSRGYTSRRGRVNPKDHRTCILWKKYEWISKLFLYQNEFIFNSYLPHTFRSILKYETFHEVVYLGFVRFTAGKVRPEGSPRLRTELAQPQDNVAAKTGFKWTQGQRLGGMWAAQDMVTAAEGSIKGLVTLFGWLLHKFGNFLKLKNTDILENCSGGYLQFRWPFL